MMNKIILSNMKNKQIKTVVDYLILRFCVIIYN